MPFVDAIGLSVRPKFFEALYRHGLGLNGLASSVVVHSVVMTTLWIVICQRLRRVIASRRFLSQAFLADRIEIVRFYYRVAWGSEHRQRDITESCG